MPVLWDREFKSCGTGISFASPFSGPRYRSFGEARKLENWSRRDTIKVWHGRAHIGVV
jgi:hypothetical protein